MERIRAGRAYCALCGNAIRPDDDALLTPDFIADDADPLWRFADATMHRPCFLVWDRRKSFVARYNRLARRWVIPGGSRWRMTSEGDIVQHRNLGTFKTRAAAEKHERAVQIFKRRGG